MNYRALAGFVLLVCTACSGGSYGVAAYAPPPAVPQRHVSSSSVIKHVVIVIQENRSFDNLFATFPKADGATRGKNHLGQFVTLKKSNLASTLNYDNRHHAFVLEYDGGRMDGFDLVSVNNGTCATCAYEYVNPDQIQPYWNLAAKYVLADRMFQTQSSASFTAHQDLIRGSTALDSTRSVVDFPTNYPWGCDAPSGTTTSLLTSSGQYEFDKGPFPCFQYPTLRDLLDAKHVSWKYYTPPTATRFVGALWNAFDAIRPVRYGPEWTKNVSSPETNLFKDVANGTLPAVSWVVPDAQFSDHPGLSATDKGPSWVAQIVNAIGKSRYWQSTAIVIVWDDWGGWYDHVAPPQLDYNGLGFRVPMIVVSPYAKNYVSHTRYEFGSILKFVENVWSLGSLGTTDVRAASIGDTFDFTQAPRPFAPVPAKYSRAYFEREPPSGMPLDDY